MDDLDRQFGTDSDRNGEATDCEGTTNAKEEPIMSVEPALASDHQPGAERFTAKMLALFGVGDEITIDLPTVSPTRSTESANTERRPGIDLLQHQLVNSVTRQYSPEITSKLRHGAVDLYSSLSPQNASDSVLARLVVGLNNMTMDCLDRVHRSSDRAREINLRYAVKGAATLVDVMKFNDARRGRAQPTVTVGKVKIEAGAQAIVGNVQTGDPQEQEPESVPRSQAKPKGD
ncbi:MAG: hypothetical protein WBD84_07660 [Methyloceanibacter sp.]